jgi:hypothetical protein
MSLTNPSQVLLRNTELLTAQNPLLINLPEDVSIQRGFQSNSKSISTADEMLSSIITLKR